jgi:two-component system sensor histidine kinase KdpD
MDRSDQESAPPQAPTGALGNDSEGELLLVAVSGSPNSCRVIEAAARLAQGLGAQWEAIHVETPDAREQAEDPHVVAEALGLAARLGAAVATIPAATVADGIDSHLGHSPATQLVLGRSRRRGATRLWQHSVAELLADRHPGLALHLLPGDPGRPTRRRPSVAMGKAPMLHHVYAFLLVTFTLVLATFLQRTTGMRGLDLLFLLPVILVSARFGLRPALLAVGLSVLGYNFFLLRPVYHFNPARPETYVILAVLLAVSTYVSILTANLRARVALSDRSARDNASVAAFALRLTAQSTWAETAHAVTEQVSTMLGVNAMLFREVKGELVVAGAAPETIALNPLSRAALDWAWSHGEAAGNGTDQLGAAEWRIEPLKTSLGTLAVLAIAKVNGGEPVRADQKVLFSTLLAQAALAHERLRLEDAQRGS